MFIKYLKIKNIPGVEDMELSFTNKINASFSKGGIGRSACVKAMKNYFVIADSLYDKRFEKSEIYLEFKGEKKNFQKYYKLIFFDVENTSRYPGAWDKDYINDIGLTEFTHDYYKKFDELLKTFSNINKDFYKNFYDQQKTLTGLGDVVIYNMISLKVFHSLIEEKKHIKLPLILDEFFSVLDLDLINIAIIFFENYFKNQIIFFNNTSLEKNFKKFIINNKINIFTLKSNRKDEDTL
jgi:hypothetical protein